MAIAILMWKKLPALSLTFYPEYKSNMIHRNVGNIFQHYTASPYIKTWDFTTHSCALSFSELTLYSTWTLQFSHYVFFSRVRQELQLCVIPLYARSVKLHTCRHHGTVEARDLLNSAVMSAFGRTKSRAFLETDDPPFKILADSRFIIISPLRSRLWSWPVHILCK